MHRTRKNKFPIAVLNRRYEVNGESMTFRDFTNKYFFRASPLKRIAPNNVTMVVGLEPGQSLLFENFNIKRLS